jgi:hypothetical protein
MKNIMTHLCVQYFLIFFSLLAEDRLSVVVAGGGAGAAIAFRIDGVSHKHRLEKHEM